MKSNLLLAAMLCCVSPLRAATTSITQSLSDPNQVYTTTFTLTGFAEISIQTWGYGANKRERCRDTCRWFDPAVALFQGTGATATLYAFNDDGLCPPREYRCDKRSVS